MTNKQIASKILDYWFTIEFLGQDSYEMCTDKRIIQDRMHKYLKSSKNEKKNNKQILFFKDLNYQDSIYDVVKSQAQLCGMSTWGNLTFYIGKVKRQTCIESLAKRLNIKLDQVEDNTDEIPVLSFQCTCRGDYIKFSLSLSTIVWALSQIPDQGSTQISELLSEREYHETLEKLKKIVFKTESSDAECNPTEISDESNEQRQSEVPEHCKDTVQSDETCMPIFTHDAVTMEKIVKICSELNTLYAGYIGERIEAHYAVRCQFFKDDKAKSNLDRDNYMGLSHDFFSSDLKMVKTCLDEGRVNFESGMLRDLLAYICAPYEGSQKERHDLVNPQDMKAFQSELSEILNLKNAPIAKWPSRYMPALMQQVAINFAVSNETETILGENSHIFSVNGPPGTGKTTLLKEIIANNVVEKARILSKYENPDEAFIPVRFKKNKINWAYAPSSSDSKESPYDSWFKFKDENIADYGVLVASCNNAAVENITKELPLCSGILDNLKPVTDGKKRDSEEFQKQLSEIRKLFSPKDTDKVFNIFKKNKTLNRDYPEVYFTGYAQKLFGENGKVADTWGLIAAPLGKKDNIRHFCQDFLEPLEDDFIGDTKTISFSRSCYDESRRLFKAQLAKVQDLQHKLAMYGAITLNAHEAAVKKEKTESQNTAEIAGLKIQQASLDSALITAEIRLHDEESYASNAETSLLSIEQKITTIRQTIDDLSKQELEYLKSAVEAENSVSVWTRIFRKSKYETALELARSYRERAESCAEDAEKCKKELTLEEENNINALATKNDAYKMLENTRTHMYELDAQRRNLEKKILLLKTEIASARMEADTARQKRDSILNEYRNGGALKSGQVLDDHFVSRALSEDKAISTEAQTLNPWATEEYNREREKLFYFALQMTKFFFLSSKHCHTNLSYLKKYWIYTDKSGSKSFVFHQENPERMMSSLFNTLFLLTPVISSTFASVGRLLKDVKEPGTIGTLIIDEAGQAQPQMAVGALFRARRSIIVGDPRQVEPVVTDDLNLLKEAYSDPIYSNYKSKSLSVQNCADILNPFGTYLKNGTGTQDWVGCPLLVHRRCISPMYEISNSISYDGMMKQKTLPPSEKKRNSFIFEKSQWINVIGTETESRNHYIDKQGQKVCELVNDAFAKVKEDEQPSLYIISPFNSIVNGIKNSLKNYAEREKDSAIAKNKHHDKWRRSNIGTVHKFQGKEANEVIFVLGCDYKLKNSYAVTGFVNSNIVNVAATRAKYRLYIIGDIDVWRNNQYVNRAKNIIDTLPLKNIAELERRENSDEKNNELAAQVSQLPGASSFVLQKETQEKDEPVYSIEADEFISTINRDNFLNKDLSENQYREFGFSSKSEFEALPAEVKKNLLLGMKLYYLLEPLYSMSPTLDASCCGILFCKAMELYLKQNFVGGLKARFPDYRIKNASKSSIKLQDAREKDFMIGTIQYILRNKIEEIGAQMSSEGEPELTAPWWSAFSEKLRSFAGKRNECCHPKRFGWQDMQQLLDYEFREDAPEAEREPRIGGVFFESEKGRKLG